VAAGVADASSNVMTADHVLNFTVDTTRPTIATSAFHTATPHSITIQFDEDISASLAAADLMLENLTTSTTIPTASISVSWNAGTKTATFTFPGLTDGILPDGNYRATLTAAGVTDSSLNALAADHVLNFTVDRTAPTVATSSFNHVAPHSISIQFSESVSASLSLADILVENLTTSSTIPSESMSLSYNSETNVATITFPGVGGGVLPGASYRLTVTGAGVTDAAGNPLAANHVLNFAVDATPPTVVSSLFNFETAQRITVQFSENVSASLSAADLTLVNLTTSTTIPPSSIVLIGYDSGTNTATFGFTALPGTILPDGNYRATLVAAGVSDSSGNAIVSNHVLDFFVLSGDANHDRTVDITDLGILATNWQQSPRGFSQGDFNYDGTVDITDLGTLATNWQVSLPEPSPRAAPAAVRSTTVTLRSRSPFSTTQLPRRATASTATTSVKDLLALMQRPGRASPM
jgi:methionine-rich copper-binding protein CopC